jgi:hypothetical protein
MGRWIRPVLEIGVVVALAATAFWYGRFAFENTSAPPDYYWMAPAITIPAGEPYGQPLPAKTSALYEFLTRRRAELTVADARGPIREPDRFDWSVKYLLLTVGYLWKLSGIRWSAVADVAAALHVLAVLGAYATLRLFMPLLLSALGALWMCTASLQLTFVPHVRDYSKGAFVLATLPLVILLASRVRSRAALLATAAAAGIMIGIGMGFKRDISIMTPIAIACIVLFRGTRPWTSLLEKTQAIAILLVALVATSYPILSAFQQEGSNNFHVILLGFADPSDDALGITRSVYRVQPYYDDNYLFAMLSARREVQTGRRPGVPSPEYDAAGQELWTRIFRHFPADVFVRAVGACERVSNLVFTNPPLQVSHPLPGSIYIQSAYSWLRQWNGWGVTLALLLVVIGTFSSLRLGALAAFLLVTLGGYPSLQFGDRHYFHLQIIPVFAVLLVTWTLLVAPWRLGRHSWRRALLSLIVVSAAVLLCVMLPLRVARAYQQRHVANMLASFLSGPKTKIEPESVRRPDGKWLLRWPGIVGTHSKAGDVAWAFYLVELAADGTASSPAMALRFRSAPDVSACPRVLSVEPTSGLVMFGIAPYTYAGHEFEGIELEDQSMRRLKAIYRMNDDGPAGIPMEFRLTPDWQRRRLYEQLQLEGTHEDATVESRAIVAFQTCS